MWAFTISNTRNDHRWGLCVRILAQSGHFSAPRRTRRMGGVRDSSPARWLPSRGQRLPLGACGGTAMRPHATLRPRLTSNTSHTSAPLRHGSIYSPALQLLAQPTRISNHWRRRRRRRRKNRRCSRPSMGLAGTERLRRSACGLKVMLATTLAIPSCIFPPSLPV